MTPPSEHPRGVLDPGNQGAGLTAHPLSIQPACSMCQAQGRLLGSSREQNRLIPVLRERMVFEEKTKELQRSTLDRAVTGKACHSEG